MHIQDNKLFIQGVAPSEQAKSKVWDQIELNPDWARELTADISVDLNAESAQPQAAAVPGGQQRTYTVKAGDSLSKISKDRYGNAGDYMKILRRIARF